MTIVTGCDNYLTQKDMLKLFGKHIGAKSINYIDYDDNERYEIVLDNGKELVLNILYNKVDGAFLSIAL